MSRNLPAPETSHAIREVINEALECKKTGEKRTIAFIYSGHGNFDLSGYDQYLEGKLLDYAYLEKEVKRFITKLPRITFPGK